jgi:hypothetical protein
VLRPYDGHRVVAVLVYSCRPVCSGGLLYVRRFTFCLALVGVLLHAVLIARHNTIMLTAHLQVQGLLADLGVICHGSGTKQLPLSDRSSLPLPSPNDSECPLCSGLALATLDLPHVATAPQVPDTAAARVAIVGRDISVRLAAVRPPSCGPPDFV